MIVEQGIFVGYRGTGNLAITDGHTVTSATASIASLTSELWTSNGSVNVDGTGSIWTVSGEFEVGGYNGSLGGTGLLKVTNGGTVSADTAYVYSSGTFAGNGTVTMTSPSAPVVTIDGTLAPSGGGTTLTINGDLTLRSGATTQCKVTPQDPSTTPQVSVSQQLSLNGRLSVTMTGDFSSAPTRFTLLSVNSFDVNNRKFLSVSITYPTDQCWYPVITYDYTGGHVYLDRLYNCN